MPKCSSTLKTVQFKLYAPQAKKVSVAGNFNKWNPKTTIAKKDKQGNWTTSKRLKSGRYEYKFYVDGNWMDDPNCNWRTSNSFGTQNCIMEVR